jgi:hypothetical protein
METECDQTGQENTGLIRTTLHYFRSIIILLYLISLSFFIFLYLQFLVQSLSSFYHKLFLHGSCSIRIKILLFYKISLLCFINLSGIFILQLILFLFSFLIAKFSSQSHINVL